MTLLLSEADLRQVLSMEDLVPLMEQALEAFSRGQVAQPIRGVVPIDDHQGFLGLMPAYVRSNRALGLKAVAFYPGNAPKGLPTHMATILYLDAGTGKLLAIMDGRLITEMRTGAVSAAATRRLSVTGTPVIALIGAGVQARSHLEALVVVCRPAEVRVWSRAKDSAHRFAEEMAGVCAAKIAPCGSVQEAVRDADVICTVTSSTAAVVKGEWVRPGAHINAVGAPRPDWRELDTDLVARARVFVDSKAAALTEAGDLVQPIREGVIDETHIQAEIGEVFGGTHPGRRGPEEITLFKSLGMAVEDVAAAHLAYQRAVERGLGQEISLS